ncbi:MAG: lysoplasmalogenase family protein [Emticicia sp.]
MKKLWLLLYFGCIPLLFFVDAFQELDILRKVGGFEATSNLILILYYIKYKKLKFVLIDFYVIEALLFTITGGILLLFFIDKQLLMFINTVGFYLTQFMFINIFRAEGSFLPALSLVIREWKMIALTIIFFIGLAFLLITFIPNSLLLISFVYSTQMIILCWMAYFRPIPHKAFYMGFVGVFLLVISNLLFALNLFYQQLQYFVVVYFVIYATSQFLLVESIMSNQNQVKN